MLRVVRKWPNFYSPCPERFQVLVWIPPQEKPNAFPLLTTQCFIPQKVALKKKGKSSICSYFVNDFRGIKQRNVSLAINNWESFLCLRGCWDILMKAENVILQFCKCSSYVSRLAIFFHFKLTRVLQALFSVCKHISNDLKKVSSVVQAQQQTNKLLSSAWSFRQALIVMRIFQMWNGWYMLRRASAVDLENCIPTRLSITPILLTRNF
jgi:hypothetical protein